MIGISRLRALAGPEGRGGAVAAEFALVVPLLVLFLFGAIQLGTTIYTYNAMLTGARNAARQIAFGSDAASARNAVRQWLPGWSANAATVNINVNDRGLARVTVTMPGRSAGIGRFVPMPAQFVAEAAIPRVADR